MIIKKELIMRKIAEDTILVPVGKTVYEANGLFVLNELGSFIWNLLPNVNSVEEIFKAVMDEYDVSEAEASKDVIEFLGKLREMDII